MTWSMTRRCTTRWKRRVALMGRYMQRNFRGWEDSGAEAEKIWTGSEYYICMPLWWSAVFMLMLG